MADHPYKITKENAAAFRIKAAEAKARYKKERETIQTLANQLAKSSPAPYLDKLRVQSEAVHACILRELHPGQGKGSWTARVMDLVKVQGVILAQREKLGGAVQTQAPAPGQVEPLDHHEESKPVLPIEELSPSSVPPAQAPAQPSSDPGEALDL